MSRRLGERASLVPATFFRTMFAFVALIAAQFTHVDGEAVAQTAPAAQADPLADSQKVMADRLAKLEDLLLRSAELEAADNPTRAALLQQAVQLSKQAQLADTLSQAADHLAQKQFSEAIERQKASRENLKRLLDLLLSENREERVREKRDQVTRWIEETERLLRMQNSLRGRTEGGQDAKQAAADQQKLSDRARQIEGELGDSEQTAEPGQENERSDSAGQPQGDEASEPQPAEGKDGSKESAETNEGTDDSSAESAGSEEGPRGEEESGGEEGSEQKAPETETGEATESSGEESEADGQQSDGKQSDGKQSSEPQDGQSPSQQTPSSDGDSQPSESGTGDGQSQASEEEPQLSNDPTERARQRIEQARRRMQEAQDELEQAEREGAIEKQIEAEKQLRQAIEELTEILRQLREEEIERSLASLESRLRKMLELQSKVLDETKRLQEIAGEQGTRQIEIRANSLSLDERKILAEGERAYLLLREEGSSAAFPEAVEQLNTDIGKVVERLEKADVGNLTVVIEQEIVSSLEEMVEALAKIQKDNKEKKEQQQQQQNSGQPQSGEQPLVDKLAEIRLIRTLQLRINNRTKALSQMLTDPADPVGQAAEAELVDELRGLGERQDSLQRVTRDIVLGTGE